MKRWPTKLARPGVCLLASALAASLVASRKFHLEWWHARRALGVQVAGGGLIISTADARGSGFNPPGGFRITRNPGLWPFVWWPSRELMGPTGWVAYAVPLWPAVPLLLGAGLLLIRTRPRAGACPSCGYDRRGISEGAACPECGALGTPPLRGGS